MIKTYASNIPTKYVDKFKEFEKRIGKKLYIQNWTYITTTHNNMYTYSDSKNHDNIFFIPKSFLQYKDNVVIQSNNVMIYDNPVIERYFEKNNRIAYMSNPYLYGDCRIFGNCKIVGNVSVKKNAKIYGNAEICMNSLKHILIIDDNVEIFGNVKITLNDISDILKITLGIDILDKNVFNKNISINGDYKIDSIKALKHALFTENIKKGI